MGGLKVGDLVLDPRRLLYIPSLKALVCVQLREALALSSAAVVKKIIQQIDQALMEYKPQYFVIFDPLEDDRALTAIQKRWAKKAEIHFITKNLSNKGVKAAEALHCAVHHDLAWNQYRFVEEEASEHQELSLGVVTISCIPSCVIRLEAKAPQAKLKSKERLLKSYPVFLKGFGRLILPSLLASKKNKDQMKSVFEKSLKLDRCDVFVSKKSTVLPLGKVNDLRVLAAIPVLKRRTPNHSDEEVETKSLRRVLSQ